MNIFEILNKLYTSKTCVWIKDIEDKNIQPFLINRWLSMNRELSSYCKVLDGYIFYLSPKHWLQLTWNVIPKREKMPFVKYIKSEKEKEEEYNFLIKKIRKYLQIADNDWEYIKGYFIKDIENNTIQYFKMFGIEKKLWKKYNIDFNEMKNKKKEEKKWF